MGRGIGKYIYIAGCLLALTRITSAVIIYDRPERNGAPTPDSPAYAGYHLQGYWGPFLGTPIAPNYFITARHVGAEQGRSFWFRNTQYTIDTTFGDRGAVYSPASDLAIWKINGTFPDFAPLYAGAGEVGQRAMLYGRGTTRGDPVFLGTQHKGWLWGEYDGFTSWGENEVASITNLGAGTGLGLRFTFDPILGQNEGFLTGYDSGGAVFIQDVDGMWKLAGIHYGVEGPYSYTGSPTDPGSPAALIDEGGLWEKVGTSYVFRTDTDVNKPSAFYATRISANLDFIISVAPGVDVSIVGLPEPGALMLSLGVTAALLRRRRRRGA